MRQRLRETGPSGMAESRSSKSDSAAFFGEAPMIPCAGLERSPLFRRNTRFSRSGATVNPTMHKPGTRQLNSYTNL